MGTWTWRNLLPGHQPDTIDDDDYWKRPAEAPMTTSHTDPEPEAAERVYPRAEDTDPGTSGVHDHGETADDREICYVCRGTGYVPTTNELLRESLGLLGDNGDPVMVKFYGNLLAVAPYLAELFPRDLLTAATGETSSRGAGQRDKLLNALLTVAQLYDQRDPAKMALLDTHLDAHGRRHASFKRSDGTDRGATQEEYLAVKVVLFNTLHEVAGDAWLPEYDDAWGEAYDYMWSTMMRAQIAWRAQRGYVHPRRVRD